MFYDDLKSGSSKTEKINNIVDFLSSKVFLIHSTSYNKKCGHLKLEQVEEQEEQVEEQEVEQVEEQEVEQVEEQEVEQVEEQEVEQVEEIEDTLDLGTHSPYEIDEQQDSNTSLSKIILESVINHTDGSDKISLKTNELSEDIVLQISEQKTELSSDSDSSTINENCDDTTKYEKGDPIPFQKGANDGNIYVYSLGNCDFIEVYREKQKVFYCGLHAVNNMLGQNMTEFLQKGPYTSDEFDAFAEEVNDLQKLIFDDPLIGNLKNYTKKI